MKDVYGNTFASLIDDVRNGQKNANMTCLRKGSARILSYIGTDMKGNCHYRRIHPGKAYGRPLISAKELKDNKNHVYISDVKYKIATGEAGEKSSGKNLLLKYNDSLISPDLSNKDGENFLQSLVRIAGNFMADTRSELDCLYLASLLGCMEQNIIIAYIEDLKSRLGVIRPFGAYKAPIELDPYHFATVQNAQHGEFDLYKIMEARERKLAGAMKGIWESVEKDLEAVFGDVRAESFLGPADGTERKGNIMRRGDIVLMSASPSDLHVLHDVTGAESGEVHDFFSVSPMSYKWLLDYEERIFDKNSSIVFTGALRRACGIDSDALFADSFLISGKDSDGNTCLVVPDGKMLTRLCGIGKYSKLSGDCDVNLRNLILGKIVNQAGDLYVSNDRVHIMENRRIIVSEGIRGDSGHERDHVQICTRIYDAAAAHNMVFKGWSRSEEGYTVSFEVRDALTGEAAVVKAPETLCGPAVCTCGMQYRFSVKNNKSFELLAVFYIDGRAVYCGDPHGEEMPSLCRKSNNVQKSVADVLIKDFFGTKGNRDRSPFALLLMQSGLICDSGTKNVFSMLSGGGRIRHPEDIEAMLAIKNGDFHGGGRDKIIYAIGRSRVEDGLRPFTFQEIAGWSLYDYVVFLSGFLGPDSEMGYDAKNKVMTFIGKLLSENEPVA